MKYLLFVACAVLGIAVIRTLGYGKPEPTTVEQMRGSWDVLEDTRRRAALAADEWSDVA